MSSAFPGLRLLRVGLHLVSGTLQVAIVFGYLRPVVAGEAEAGSCTAIVEHFDGRLELVRFWQTVPAAAVAPAPTLATDILPASARQGRYGPEPATDAPGG